MPSPADLPVEVGLDLGLPHAWLEALPAIGLLPGAHLGWADDARYGAGRKEATEHWESRYKLLQRQVEDGRR